VTARAKADIAAARSYIALTAPLNALRWMDELRETLHTLEVFPDKHGIARERKHRRRDLRQLVLGTHRVLFTVMPRAKIVVVHRVLHASQDRWRR
jgi:plasmid stabilization system protein ParE